MAQENNRSLRQRPIEEDDDGDFVEQPPTPPPSGGKMPKLGMGGGDMKTVVLSFIVTLVVLALMSFVGGVSFVTKKDFTANMDGFTVASEQAKVELSQLQSQVTASIQNMPVTITNQVNNSVAQATSQYSGQISSVSDRLTGLNSNVQDNSAKVKNLESEVADLEDKISELEDRIEELTSPDDGASGIDVEVKAMSHVMMPSDNSTLIADFKVVLTNTTAVDVSDIVLGVAIETGITYPITTFTLTGGGTVWQGYGWDAQHREFVNSQWGLNVVANSTKTLYLRATVVGDGLGGHYPTGVGYGIDVEVE